jgi:hypothetical protein
VHKKPEKERKGFITHSQVDNHQTKQPMTLYVKSRQERKKERKKANMQHQQQGRIEKRRRLSMMGSMEMNLIQVQEEPCLLPLLPHLCSCFVESYNISFFFTPLSLLEYCSRDQT